MSTNKGRSMGWGRMTDKIKMRGKCSKKGKCEGAGCTIIMPVGNSGIFRSSCKIN